MSRTGAKCERSTDRVLGTSSAASDFWLGVERDDGGAGSHVVGGEPRVPGEDVPVLGSSGDLKMLENLRGVEAAAGPRDLATESERTQAAFPALPVETAFIFFVLEANRFQEPPMRPNVLSSSSRSMP